MRTLDVAWERAKLLREWKIWVDKIAEAAERILGEDLLGIYVFGSLMTEKMVASSDVDLLVVSKVASMPLIKRSDLKTRMLEKAGLPLVHPFEIHLVDKKEADAYFQHIQGKFIKIR